jgi:hypothetical protein
MFDCEATAGQSAYVLLIFVQKIKILVVFFPCFLKKWFIFCVQKNIWIKSKNDFNSTLTKKL